MKVKNWRWRIEDGFVVLLETNWWSSRPKRAALFSTTIISYHWKKLPGSGDQPETSPFKYLQCTASQFGLRLWTPPPKHNILSVQCISSCCFPYILLNVVSTKVKIFSVLLSKVSKFHGDNFSVQIFVGGSNKENLTQKNIFTLKIPTYMYMVFNIFSIILLHWCLLVNKRITCSIVYICIRVPRNRLRTSNLKW